MNTRFFKVLILTFIFFSPVIKAVNIEWMNGYIVTLNNDTVNGMLGYRNGAGDWKECLFKETQQSEPIAYAPREILSYGYEKGLTYISKKINVPQFKEFVFVEALLTGVINLYHLKIENCPEYPNGESSFIAEAPSGKMLQLKEDKALETENLTKQQNKAKLKFLFAEYPELTPQIDNTKIERESLIELFSNFHKIICSDFTCMSYKEKKSPRRWWITPRIGVAINHFEAFNGWHPGWIIGAFGTTNLSKFTDRFVLNIGLELNMSPDYTYLIDYYTTKKGWSYILTNFFSLESRSMNGTVRPFFEIGFHQNYIIAQEYTMNDPSGYYNLGVMAGTGMYLHLKKCELPIRFQYFYGRKVDMFTLSIGYTFKLR